MPAEMIRRSTVEKEIKKMQDVLDIIKDDPHMSSLFLAGFERAVKTFKENLLGE